MAKHRIPAHIGFIPDGNRRWAEAKGLSKENGYYFGIDPGVALLDLCVQRGIKEISIYGFTQDNAKRPSVQLQAFREACVRFGLQAVARGASLVAVGDRGSPVFPDPLKPFVEHGAGAIRVNLLVNYGWDWDLAGMKEGGIRSDQVSRLDLIVRWGGGRRLSGFLPVQSVYADFYVVDELWPDFHPEQFDRALAWFRKQDQTLGG